MGADLPGQWVNGIAPLLASLHYLSECISSGFLTTPHVTYSTIDQKQAVPRTIDTALGKAGATRLTEFASGDADSTLEESFEEWKFALWEGLSAHLGICG